MPTISTDTQVKKPFFPVQGFPDATFGVQFTAADFVRSVNKKVRQNYIRKRLKVRFFNHSTQNVGLKIVTYLLLLVLLGYLQGSGTAD